jgi:hypothetical protein
MVTFDTAPKNERIFPPVRQESSMDAIGFTWKRLRLTTSAAIFNQS